MRKHILLIFFSYYTPKDAGGLRSWHIGTHLARKNFRVTAIIPGVDPLSQERNKTLRRKLWYREYIDEVEVIWVNSTENDRKSKVKRGLYFLTSSLLQIAASLLVKQVDLIITASMPFSSLLLTYLQSTIRGVPFMVDVRDLSIDAAVELKYLHPNWMIKNILSVEKWLFNQADCLIAVSQGWKDRLVEKDISPDKIVVIPLGFDGKEILEKYIDWDRDIKKEYNFTDKFIVLYAGTIGHVFDINTLIEVANLTKEQRNIIYVFVGTGQLIEHYRIYSRNNNLNCIFLGKKSKYDMLLFCSQADICICPFKEGKFLSSLLGNKIFDYLGSGTAVIYSGPEGDTSKLIKHSRGGVCVPAGDAYEIARNIKYFYDNSKELTAIGKRAQKYIYNNCTASLMMDKFTATVSSVLASQDSAHNNL